MEAVNSGHPEKGVHAPADTEDSIQRNPARRGTPAPRREEKRNQGVACSHGPTEGRRPNPNEKN